jgi:hypothetical protein
MEVKNAYKSLVGNLKGKVHSDEARADKRTTLNSIPMKEVSRQ